MISIGRVVAASHRSPLIDAVQTPGGRKILQRGPSFGRMSGAHIVVHILLLDGPIFRGRHCRIFFHKFHQVVRFIEKRLELSGIGTDGRHWQALAMAFEQDLCARLAHSLHDQLQPTEVILGMHCQLQRKLLIAPDLHEPNPALTGLGRILLEDWDALHRARHPMGRQLCADLSLQVSGLHRRPPLRGATSKMESPTFGPRYPADAQQQQGHQDRHEALIPPTGGPWHLVCLPWAWRL
mmetsp:Transcript_60174/g.131814  ORF Transcript_60174/g.131814 Transcript_60174/m.131814 type:complete len:238 (+) Transcript_60174:713-1426(+)